MNDTRLIPKIRIISQVGLVSIIFLMALNLQTLAHPLGNFTINHYARLSVGAERIEVRYVVDMAEIPTFQVLQKMDESSDNTTPSSAELNSYAARAAAEYGNGLLLAVDGTRIPLRLLGNTISLPPGAGGLSTLRLECDFEGIVPANSANAVRHLRFEDANQTERIGWREIVISPQAGVAVFDSTAYGNGVTDEIKAYPNDMLTAPLNERVAEMSFTRGAVPVGARPLLARNGRKIEVSRDRLAELIAVPELTLGVALIGLVFAIALGGFHALSPGHGKTIVAAYLVGTRGTARHAAFLGLTVTVTHTAGVFALGLVTLFAAEYIVPEKLYPIISFISGAIVLVIGVSLLIYRLRAAFNPSEPAHAHHAHPYDGPHHAADHEHIHHDHPHHHHHHEHAHHHHHHHAGHTHDEHDHAHHHHARSDAPALTHSHGGKVHSHLPPGADGAPVTWRSLLALGVSGGLVPCPSALVVLLAAISGHHIGYGLLLVVAFSAGLAVVLTGIGLLFVYARRLVERPLSSSGRLVRVVPVFSAFVISCVGALICYQALDQAGIHALALISRL